MPLVDYYTDQYISSSGAVNQGCWPVAHNPNSNDTLFMQLGEQQLKFISNPASLHLHPTQNNAALLINAHHQLQTASLYSNSPSLLTPNLNSPNIELATLTRQNIYRTLNKRSGLGDEFISQISQSPSMLMNTHQLPPQN